MVFFGIVENKIIVRKRTDGLKNLVGSFKISNKVKYNNRFL